MNIVGVGDDKYGQFLRTPEDDRDRDNPRSARGNGNVNGAPVANFMLSPSVHSGSAADNSGLAFNAKKKALRSPLGLERSLGNKNKGNTQAESL